MKKVLLLLLMLQLLCRTAGTVGTQAAIRETNPTPETVPAAVSQPVHADDSLAGLLERIGAEYDPVAAGGVGALRWAGKHLESYAGAGGSPDAAEEAAVEYAAAHPADGDLEAQLLRLRRAALQIASGEDLGLIRDGGRRSSMTWTAGQVEELFAALFRGAGLEPPGE